MSVQRQPCQSVFSLKLLYFLLKLLYFQPAINRAIGFD